MIGQTADLSAMKARRAAPGSVVVRSAGITKPVRRVVAETAIIFRATAMTRLMIEKKIRLRVCGALGLQFGISGRNASAKARPKH